MNVVLQYHIHTYKCQRCGITILLYGQFLYVFKITDLELAKLELNRETERLQGQSNDNSTQLDQLSAELTETKQLLQERDGSLIVLQQQIDTQVLSLKLLYI